MAIFNKSALKQRLNPLVTLRSEKGIALLIALFALTLMIFIATEVSNDTTIEYVVASQQAQRVKAYYAAHAGLELSLLRVQIYKAAMVQFGSQLGSQSSILDMIWQFPMSWPPVFNDPKVKMTEVDKDLIQTSLKDSLMDGQYATTIEPITGKLNLNDLASDIKTVATYTHQALTSMFDHEMRTNDDFRSKYGAVNFEEVINNIYDWMSTDLTSANGGDKKSRYEKLDLKDTNRDFIPPGRPFKTMDELHMVTGMKDDFYKMIESRFTVYGTQGVNINYAPKEVLMSLDLTFTSEAADAVIKRRGDLKLGGPFPSGQDCESTFFQFIGNYGVNTTNIQNSKIPLMCDSEYNFRVTSTGLYQKSKREITVVTFDLDNLSARLAYMLNQQDSTNGSSPTSSQTTTPTSTTPTGTQSGQTNQPNQPPKMKAPQGRPIVVYWEET